MNRANLHSQSSNLLDKTVNTLFFICIVSTLLSKYVQRGAFFALVLIALFVWIRSFWHPSETIKNRDKTPNRLNSLIAGISIFYFLSALLSHYLGIPNKWGRSAVWETYSLFLGLGPLLYLVAKTTLSRKTLYFSVGTLCILGSVKVFLQEFAFGGIARNIFDVNTNEYVSPMLVSCFICVTFVFTKIKFRILSVLCVLFSLVSIIMIENKAGLLILTFGLAILLYFNMKRFRVLSSISVLLAMLILASTHSGIQYRLKGFKRNFSSYISGKNNDTSVGHRVEMLKFGLDLFKKNPLMGVGPRAVTVDQYRDNYVKGNKALVGAVDHWHFHNQYIEAVATRGLIGLLALISLLLIPLMFFFKMNSQDKKEFALSGFSIFFVFSMVSFSNSPLEFKFLSIFFIVLIVLIINLASKLHSESADTSK